MLYTGQVPAGQRSVIKIIIVVVILACIGPFFITGPDGEPLLTLDDLRPDLASPLGDDSGGDDPGAAPKTLYKWQDVDGVWHFSDREEDAHMAGAEQFEAEAPVNVMQEFKAPPPERAASGLPATTTTTPVPTISGGLETLKAATELQGTIDSRKAEMDEQLKKAGGG